MSEITNEKLLEMIQAMQATAGNAHGGRSRRNEPSVEIDSVSVPVKIDLGRETVRVYLKCKVNPTSQRDLKNLIDDMFDQGFEVDVWPKKREYNNGGKWSR